MTVETVGPSGHRILLEKGSWKWQTNVAAGAAADAAKTNKLRMNEYLNLALVLWNMHGASDHGWL